MASFGIVSLALTALLGVIVSAEVQHLVARRGVEVLTNTTKSAIAITANEILTGLSTNTGGQALTAQQEHNQSDVISSAARTLVANSEIVATEAVLANGTVIGGAASPAVGTRIPLDGELLAAFRGGTSVRTLGASGRATTAEQQLLHRYGDLLVVDEGVRLSPGGSIVGVVRSYAPLGPARARAAADAWSIIWLLALGLLVFWIALFRLVWGASRALTRNSKASEYLATHDSLTGLPNRALLRDRTERAVLASRRSGTHVALVLIDLDRFKEVNDTLGHPYGDMLLKQVGARLVERLRESDTVARLGGDEFVVMLPDLRAPELALVAAEKLVVGLHEPFALDGVVVDVSASSGVATTPDDGEDFDELLQHADVAMYAAKGDGLGAVSYTPALDSNSPARLRLLADLRRAVDDPDQIVLHYQPQADLGTGQIVGVEALVRWQHPTLGLLGPDEFIPPAERTGIIRPLTWRILRAALEQNRRWAREGLVLRVSVNISARCLLDAGFADEVGRMLIETEVPPERLELELTETAVMTDPDRALGVFQDLAGRGIGLSIDDFGTGYSSMAYLKKLPVREIKIDRAFITNMDRDPSDAAIVRSSLDLARNLNLTVVAEGVETLEVCRQLSELHCSKMQGYYLSRPLPSSDFTEWIGSRLPIAATGTVSRATDLK